MDDKEKRRQRRVRDRQQRVRRPREARVLSARNALLGTIVAAGVLGVYAWRRSDRATEALSQFQPTVANAPAAPGSAPDGMVWIPGGEFSMGAADPRGADDNDVGMNATTDSRPIHRVYVDGFWM